MVSKKDKKLEQNPDTAEETVVQETPAEPENVAQESSAEADMAPVAEPVEEKTSKNVVIVAVLAVIVVVLALMYMWGANLVNNDEDLLLEPEPATEEVDKQLEALKNVSTSDELGAIDQDVNNTELEDIDAGLDKLEEELGKELAE